MRRLSQHDEPYLALKAANGEVIGKNQSATRAHGVGRTAGRSLAHIT